MERNKLILSMILAVTLMSCGRKKCLVCTDVTYKVAKQSDYDKGYMPDEEKSCEGETYIENGAFHKWTHEELMAKKEKYDRVGNYQCEWK